MNCDSDAAGFYQGGSVIRTAWLVSTILSLIETFLIIVYLIYLFVGIIIITIYMGMEQWSFLDTTQMF